MHLSILPIKEKYKDPNFSFSSVIYLPNLQNELQSWDSIKSIHETDMPIDVLKVDMDIFSRFLLNYFNNIIDFSSFPYHLKLVNTAPVHKKDSQNDKKNYRLVSLLSNISKVFENILKEWSRQYQFLSIWKFEVLAGLPSNFSSSNATKSLQQRQSISLVSAWHFPHWHYPMFPTQFCRDSGWLFFPFLSGMWPHWKLLAWFCFSDSN